MGEVALRRTQAGVEITRGTAVAATRKLYGVLEPSRDQGRRYAQEERGTLIDKFRANAKLVVAGFKFSGDVLFEDMPYYLDTSWAGGVRPVRLNGASSPTTATGYAWNYVGAVAADNLGTRTFEWGDRFRRVRPRYAGRRAASLRGVGLVRAGERWRAPWRWVVRG